MTSNIMPRRDTQTSPSAAHLAEQPAGRTKVPVAVAEEDSTPAPERCIQPFAPSAARTQKFLSGLVATDPCTAVTALASSAQVPVAAAEDPMAGTRPYDGIVAA
jgi:hypothetical protein